MLKSTYKPSSNHPPPLPPDWTEHKAPTGHTYYYNARTKESTYTRPAPSPSPAADAIAQPVPPPPRDPHASFFQYSTIPQLSDPATANAFLAQYDPSRQRQTQQRQYDGHGGHRKPPDGRGDRPRPQPVDKPKSKVTIPGCEPWLLVYTKYGRRFAYNPVKNASYWRIPDKIMKGVLELDIRGAQEKAAGAQDQKANPDEPASTESLREASASVAAKEIEKQVDLDSDYEEVEVTDDEGEGDGDEDENNANGHHSKRQRTEEPSEDMPVEFNEDDFAYQLQAMGDDYGLDPGEYDDGNPDAWPEGAEGLLLSDTDAKELFKDLLNDYDINPYSPWDKLIEEGRIVDDSRYIVLSTMKARKEVWEEWSRERIQILKEQRAKEEKKDPKIPYLTFLQQKATPKLYWPEFRRKYKKEPPMRDSSLNDRDREKWYREHINRLKLPPEALKKDLTALLRGVSLRSLNKTTHLENLPPQILADVRYISLDPQIRDPLIEAYIQTLGSPPTEHEVEEDETAQKAREERRRREKALEERERVVAEEKRRQKRQLEYGKAALREEERELERAMNVGKKGLQSQLLAVQKTGETGE
ncbi:hypothetical protein F4805DRAFT_96392 [Annulohypoxylon moriforme]|nr:hypothetical protein F4805DRAFT_96392 [Annulohypoxylon moriforme]